jgi:NADH-quinone oxidoreductase subunit G
MAHRLRQAAKRGAKIYKLHSADDDWLMPIAGKRIVAPSELLNFISSFQEELSGGKNAAILLGNFAQQHAQAAQIHAAAQALAQATNAKLGFLGEAANSVGGYLAGLPVGGNAGSIVENPPKALVLLNVEPELDCADPRAAMAATKRAEFVVALSAFRTGLDYANVILPIGAFTETAGTFVNTEGRAQSFHPSVNPPGEARPGWKVLRVLGSMLGVPGFELDTIDEVRAQCLQGKDIAALLSNRIDLQPEAKNPPVQGIQRVADVPIYFADPLVRRSPPLQATADAQPPKVWMNGRLMARCGFSQGNLVLVKQGGGEARLEAALDERLPDECVRIAAAHRLTAELGPMSGTVSVEKIPVEQAA